MHRIVGGSQGARVFIEGSLKPKRIMITTERRPDGGLRVYSDDVPGFVLSGVDSDAVRADIIPALETILTEVYGRVKVRLDSSFTIRSVQTTM